MSGWTRTALFCITTALFPGAYAQNTTVVPSGLGGWFDVSNRDDVRRAYDVIIATTGVAMGWTGSFSPPNAGTTSPEYRTAVMARINWDRAMGGVPAAITLNSAESAEEQQAAFMMMSNQQLNHVPPSTWVNYTAQGAEGAAHANLCFGVLSDPGCGLLYVEDPGLASGPAGHRRWLLYPQTTEMGTGDVGGTGGLLMANALWIYDLKTYGNPRPAVRDTFVSWPPPGYVPYQAVFPRWSFDYPAADFKAATVSMQQDGHEVAVHLDPVENGYGENAISWVINNEDGEHAFTPTPPANDTVYTVTVSNVVINGKAQSFTYNVDVFDPASKPVFTASTKKETVTASGGTGNISINVAPAATEWIATSSAPWLTITGGAVGRGSGTVAWSMSANAVPASRSATITAGTAVVTFTQAGSGDPASVADVNAASSQIGPVAPESIASAYSSDLANTTTQATTIPLPMVLGNTSVTVTDSAGTKRPAGLFFVSNGPASQVNYEIPPGTANGPATVEFTSGDGTTVRDTIQVESVAPGLFLLNSAGLVAGDIIRVRGGVQTREKVFTSDQNGNILDSPIDLGPPTDSVYLELYGTGIRNAGVAPATCVDATTVCTPVTVAIGGVNAPVLFAGAAPGLVGLDQVNVQLPRSLIGAGVAPITLVAAGRLANTVHIAIK